jgi:chromosome segregation ATPase
MHKRSSGAITPQEQRMLIAVQTRINNLNTRLSANGKKINSMKEQMSHLKTEVEENDSTIAQMEHEEDILRMQFIEAKLQYEYGKLIHSTHRRRI